VESLQASGTGPQPAAHAVPLVAAPGCPVGIALRQVPAVQGARGLAEAAGVFHDVDLAVMRPSARSQYPEQASACPP
jgi:hypothetical protein